ncbi:Crp/Fnr family transcriptional regulator [Olivibacter domesticus]|uniref:cAMP-binding domain of CRP or a regulatory subunit of cAMP-dependent protein kinases n=1 Tax=Olivibacter domesticus TaxID=407022 RepID=A0A1H7HTM4_OLID1|nr:Crp/Fnr family transcriptional regulator [Olivibacter domesticus]SEK51545.1 cAMP-binding domain of CRP or a regulatory subunit of cAMP-dependent protein kinases [Olivibacter domesticus]
MSNNKELQEKIFAMGLTNHSFELFWSTLEKVDFKKGKHVIQAGRKEHYLYFIVQGIARVYLKSEKEITFCFCAETDVILSYNSYFNQMPGYENIELLENSTLLKISHKKIKELCSQDIKIANFFNKVIGLELVKTEERLISVQSKTASERYIDLLSSNPSIVQRVQLGYIASYLGISQVTLSRIRAKQ